MTSLPALFETTRACLQHQSRSVHHYFTKSAIFFLKKKKSSTYAIFLSSFLNHLTSLGDPNIKKQITDNNNVQAPKNNEIHLQGASPPYFCAWDPMPYMERLPMMPKPALADWKKREREECSSRVYQLPMTRTKPGLMVHSKNPWRARRIMRWVQFWAAPMQVTQTPGCEEEERVGQLGFSSFFSFCCCSQRSNVCVAFSFFQSK